MMSKDGIDRLNMGQSHDEYATELTARNRDGKEPKDPTPGPSAHDQLECVVRGDSFDSLGEHENLPDKSINPADGNHLQPDRPAWRLPNGDCLSFTWEVELSEADQRELIAQKVRRLNAVLQKRVASLVQTKEFQQSPPVDQLVRIGMTAQELFGPPFLSFVPEEEWANDANRGLYLEIFSEKGQFQHNPLEENELELDLLDAERQISLDLAFPEGALFRNQAE